MDMVKTKLLKRRRRQKRVRARVFGTALRPRLAVFRSQKHIYAQLIDDTAGRTLAAASDAAVLRKVKGKAAKVSVAHAVGQALAAAAREKKIGAVAFDRGGYLYAGRVRALAEAARLGGLKF